MLSPFVASVLGSLIRVFQIQPVIPAGPSNGYSYHAWEIEKPAVYAKTYVRVVFSGQYVVQAVFGVSESVDDVFRLVRDVHSL